MLDVISKQDTRDERIRKLLTTARKYLPAKDDFLIRRDKQIRETKGDRFGIHTSTSGNWLFYEKLENNQFLEAWDELEWAFQRYDVMQRMSGTKREFPDPENIGASRAGFWMKMSYAAREITQTGESPAHYSPLQAIPGMDAS